MFRHVGLFRFTDEATAAQRQAVFDELSRLPAQIPELVSYVIGPDAGLATGNFDFAVTADFDDRAGYEVYAAHPAHQAVAAAYVRPILAERAAVQFDAPSPVGPS